MTDAERMKRITEHLTREEKTSKLEWWWLSFILDGKFAGACIVLAKGLGSATREAHKRKCNPGGSVRGSTFPAGMVPAEKWRNRLLSKSECTAFDKENTQ